MIITDLSQIIKATVFVDSTAQQIASNPSDENKGFIKHFMLNSIRANFVANKKKYGQMILAADSNTGYWRRDYFPNYKCQRRAARQKDETGINWSWVMGVADDMIQDLELYFPFPTIRVNKAEGDDIIGVLTKLFSTDPSYLKEDVFGDNDPEDILIISSDRDNFQLHKYSNVKQWSPVMKKLVKPDVSWKHSLIEKIIKGESGAGSDSIPNLRSPDDQFLQEGVRQKSITTDRLNAFIAAKDLNAVCESDEERRNLVRNQTLVNYEYIPEWLSSDIISRYNEQVAKKASKMALMDYMTRNRMSNLLSNISDFYL